MWGLRSTLLSGAKIDPIVTHEEITKSVVDYIKKNSLHNIPWWATAFGGTIIAKVTEQLWIIGGKEERFEGGNYQRYRMPLVLCGQNRASKVQTRRNRI